MEPDMRLAVIRAALRLASERMRRLPRPEPEVYALTALQDAMATEGVPESMNIEVDKLARVLAYFGDSVRAAERKGAPIVPFPGEILPPAKKR